MTESSNLIEVNTIRSAELIQEFKLIAVDERNDPTEEFELTVCLEHIMDSLLQKSIFSQVTYNIVANEVVIINSYSTYWFQILEGLLANSVVHGFKNGVGKVDITVDVHFDRVSIAFRDNGRGVSEDEVVSLFEPFFTSKRYQGHIGLGLHVLFNLISQTLKGSLRYVQTGKQGACFIIELPISLPRQSNTNLMKDYINV